MKKRVSIAIALMLAFSTLALAAPSAQAADSGNWEPPSVQVYSLRESGKNFAQVDWNSKLVDGGTNKADGYNVYRDGKFLGSTKNVYFKDKTVDIGPTPRSHRYQVVAYEKYSSSKTRYFKSDTVTVSLKLLKPYPAKMLEPRVDGRRVVVEWRLSLNAAKTKLYRNGKHIATTTGQQVKFYDNNPLAGKNSYYVIHFGWENHFFARSPNTVSVNYSR